MSWASRSDTEMGVGHQDGSGARGGPCVFPCFPFVMNNHLLLRGKMDNGYWNGTGSVYVVSYWDY